LEPQKKPNWLDEVKRDAEFNFKKRLRDERERREYEQSKYGQAETKPPAK
jgi:hypothetical protein